MKDGGNLQITHMYSNSVDGIGKSITSYKKQIGKLEDGTSTLSKCYKRFRKWHSSVFRYLDIEIEDKWDKQIAINFANAFIKYVQSQGYSIGIYTGYYFYKDYLKGNIPQVPLWIASYGKEPPTYPEDSWQYSENGQILGAIGKVDLNYFNENILLSNGGIKKVESIVVYHYGADEHSAEILADFLQCPTISSDKKFDYSCVKNVYGVGCKKEDYTSYLTKLISGVDKYGTCRAVLDFIANGGK